MITFFTQDENKNKQKEGHEGEVPEVFQNRFFNIGIAGYKWVAPTALRTNTLSAKLLFNQLNAVEFTEILRTETISGVSSPHFTKQARFSPLLMYNSQAYASSSVFRVEVIVNSNIYTTAEFTLAQLLWDRVFETSMDPYVSTMFGKNDPGGGLISVSIVMGRPIEYPVTTQTVAFSVRAHSSLWKRVMESSIILAVSRTAQKGRWSRIFTSKRLQKPTWTSSSAAFPRFCLDRNELSAFNPRNPIRIEIYGVRWGNQVLLGFFRCVFEELLCRETLEWHQTSCSYLYTEMKFSKREESVACSEFGITLGIFNRRKEILTAHKALGGTESGASNIENMSARSWTEKGGARLSRRCSAVSGYSDSGRSITTPSKEVVCFADDSYNGYWEEETDSCDEIGA